MGPTLKQELVDAKRRLLHLAWTHLEPRELRLLKTDLEITENASPEWLADFELRLSELRQ